MKIDCTRELALKILYEVNEEGAYSNIALNRHLTGANLNSTDKGFITELVFGVIKWKLKIDWIIGQFSSIRLKKISPWILNIIRLGIYQLVFLDRIPESAACNESVNLSRKYGHKAASGFVNAVLRKVAQNAGNINYPGREDDPIKYLSVTHSHPEWLVREWLSLFGTDFTEGLLEENNRIPDFTIRVNTLKTSLQELQEKLHGAGFETEPGSYVADAVIVKNPAGIMESDLFKGGFFQVQDQSSMLAGKILDPKPGELIIDVCSAPGGKATHIAQMMGNRGTVIARDVHEHKLKLIMESAKRLGIGIIKTELFDAAIFDESMTGKADRVLADVPCTGLGIIRRKPDIKWSREENNRDEITALQKKILRTAALYVKPGGILVYSTCTIGPYENEDVVNEFLTESGNFHLDDIYIHLYPNINKIDGFFISRMVREG